MFNFEDLSKDVIDFRDARDWKQFHNPKDCTLSLILEASELAEHFQWKNKEEMEEHIRTKKGDISDELADVLYWVILISHDLDINLEEALKTKMIKNGEKYPIEKAKGRHTKYTEL